METTTSLPSTTESSNALCLTFAVSGIVGGVATILVYLWIVVCIAVTERLHTISNYFLASLCAFEICVGIGCIWGSNVAQTFFQKHLVLYYASVISYILCTGSSYLLNSVLIAADRYMKIARPLQYLSLMSDRRCVQLITAVWIIWLILVLSVFVYILKSFEADEIFMEEILSTNRVKIPITVISNVTVFLLVVCVAWFIVALVRIARKQKRRIQTEMQMLGHIRHAQQKDGVDCRVSEPVQLQARGSNKTTVYFIVHFTAYVTAWVPAIVTLNIYSFSSIPLEYKFITFSGGLILGLAQLLLGTLFLVYMQIEHRQSCRTTWQKLLAFFQNYH